MIDMNNPVAMAQQIVDLREALREVLEGMGALNRPWELTEECGIESRRAEEICGLVE